LRITWFHFNRSIIPIYLILFSIGRLLAN
jgi:hypothetical protein